MPEDTTQQFKKTDFIKNALNLESKRDYSHFFNVSIRAWIGILIVITMCVLCLGVVFLPVFVPVAATVLTTASIPDVLKDAFLVTIAFYYGQGKSDGNAKSTSTITTTTPNEKTTPAPVV